LYDATPSAGGSAETGGENCSLLLDASIVWEADCEVEALGYQTEVAEYAHNNPRPTLKAFLLANAGMFLDPLA